MDYKKPKKSKEEVDKNISEPQITFDVYFQVLLKAGKVMPHHKLPMKAYAEKVSKFTSASIEEFEQLFRNY